MIDNQTREQASINAAVFIENDHLRNLLKMERKAAKEKSRRLEKAEHDRQRYARRIRLLQAQQQMLSREYNAIRLERDILKTALESCERRLLYDAGRATEAGTGAEECGQASSSGSCPEARKGHQDDRNL